MASVTGFIERLEKRIAPDATLSQAEEWWSLALTIGSSLERDDESSGEEKAASHRLLWAVSAAVRAVKRFERPDQAAIHSVLASLERSVRDRPSEGNRAALPN
ncbi:hypothetical protein [Aureimonas psammosilenae]|uniref:hypothetical protein n=1 Tax=Aureimonas psammosilenae TaxID=2495496 RepID=UPI001261392C|nr:hypothetical protein [Aureimonas psammosilenae]